MWSPSFLPALTFNTVWKVKSIAKHPSSLYYIIWPWAESSLLVASTAGGGGGGPSLFPQSHRIGAVNTATGRSPARMPLHPASGLVFCAGSL